MAFGPLSLINHHSEVSHRVDRLNVGVSNYDVHAVWLARVENVLKEDVMEMQFQLRIGDFRYMRHL